MVEFAKKNKHIDVVMVDPPRKGCSQVFLDQLITLAPDKVVYISCDVATIIACSTISTPYTF